MDSHGSISYLDPILLTRKSRTHKPTSSSIETAAKVIKFPILTIHSSVVPRISQPYGRLRENAKEKVRNYALR